MTIPDKNNSMVEITGAVRAVMHNFFRRVFGIISGGPSSIENAFLVHLELIARSSNSDANGSLIESKLHLLNIIGLQERPAGDFQVIDVLFFLCLASASSC